MNLNQLLKNPKTPKAGAVISVLVSLPLIMSSVMKLIQHPQVIEGMDHLGLPQTLIIPVGLLELLCVFIYLIPKTSVLGAVLFTGYMGGAIATHLRLGEGVFVQALLPLLFWLGIYLREPRLHSVLPLRK